MSHRSLFSFELFCLVDVLLTHCVTQLKLYTVDKLSSPIFGCLSVSVWVCEASVTPDQISTFSNIYRPTSPLLTLYHLIPSSTNLYWQPVTTFLTQYNQVPLIIHHLERHTSANWIISVFTTHLKCHAQYTWSSFGVSFAGLLLMRWRTKNDKYRVWY